MRASINGQDTLRRARAQIAKRALRLHGAEFLRRHLPGLADALDGLATGPELHTEMSRLAIWVPPMHGRASAMALAREMHRIEQTRAMMRLHEWYWREVGRHR